MLILGKKGANFDQKAPKMGGARFFRTANINFPKENYKTSIYKKSTKYNKLLGRYELKGLFWTKKWQIWTKKGPKWAGLDFSGL